MRARPHCSMNAAYLVARQYGHVGLTQLLVDAVDSRWRRRHLAVDRAARRIQLSDVIIRLPEFLLIVIRVVLSGRKKIHRLRRRHISTSGFHASQCRVFTSTVIGARTSSLYYSISNIDSKSYFFSLIAYRITLSYSRPTFNVFRNVTSLACKTENMAIENGTMLWLQYS